MPRILLMMMEGEKVKLAVLPLIIG